MAALLACGAVVGVAAQGLVQGVLGTALSPEPGQAASQRLRGGTALQLEQLQLDGRAWSHLLGSDGRHGWTPQPLGTPAPVLARALGTGFELMPVAPGATDFLSSRGLPVRDGAAGRLLGGSRESLVADTHDLMVPAWLNATRAPWPKWAMDGGVEGYATVYDVTLAWPKPLPSAAPGAALDTTDPWQLLGAWGLHGLSRAPFLGPVAQALQRHAPLAGWPALDLSGMSGKVALRALPAGAWRGPLSAYRSPSANAAGLAVLLSFGQGKARAWVLLGRTGAPLLAFSDTDALFISRLDEADLDGDGRAEWLLEVVGSYGDGYHSSLWVVDGRSAQSGLRIARQPLSLGTGEGAALAQDAAWWVDAANTVWVWRSSAAGSSLSAQRYVGRRLASTGAPARPAVVVLGTDTSPVAAGQRMLQAQQRTPQAAVVPQQTAAGLRWITAVPFSGVPQARQWAARQGLPAAAVHPLPWRP